MKTVVTIDNFAVPRDMAKITDKTGNSYESIAIIAKRANQIAKQEKEELTEKLSEFAPKTDTLEEVFDNREQLEISSHYERLPKPTIVAIQEFLEDKIYFRNPARESNTEE